MMTTMMMIPLLKMLLVIVTLTSTHVYGLPQRGLSPQLQENNWYIDGQTNQFQSTDGYPIYKENISPQQTVQFNWDQSQQNAFNGYETGPSESQKQENTGYTYEQQQPYPSTLDSLTLTCNGKNKVCVAKDLCVNGYVHPLKQGFTRSEQECKLKYETCCTVQYELYDAPYDNTVLKDNRYLAPNLEFDQKYVGDNNQPDVSVLKPPLGNDDELQSGTNDRYAIKSATPASANTEINEPQPYYYNQIPSDTNQQEQFQPGLDGSEANAPSVKTAPAGSAVFQFTVQSGCAAALLCVEEQYCTLEGVISTQPVAFSSEQLLRRVPLSSCRNRETGAVGKCCRDPNYVDPWPTGNLPANYTGGFDEQGFPTFLNIAKVRPPTKKQPTKTSPKPTLKPFISTTIVPLSPDYSHITQQVIPISTPTPIIVSTTARYDPAPSNQEQTIIVQQPPSYQCGVRNFAQRPTGFKDTDVAFGEIPWQAMVLWSEHRKILCSGALLAPDAVITAASCVDRFAPSELSVKLGEWKLGVELKDEEPLPFEIIDVRTIKYHPGYIHGLASNDTAMLILEHPVTFDLHINTLCLPDEFQVQESSQCIVTGWGKSILQAHYAGAIMHMVDVNLLPYDVCQNRIYNAKSHIPLTDDVICGKAYEENNMCQADVGAPLACYDNNGAYHLVGIYSQDTGCLPTNQVATFAPIDLNWVRETMHIPQESEIDVINIDNSYDYRKSYLPPINQYLPPV